MSNISVFTQGNKDQKEYLDIQGKTIKRYTPYDFVYVEPQEYMGEVLYADTYTDSEYILHTNFSSLFTDKYQEDYIFEKNKPLMPYTSYETILKTDLPSGMTEQVKENQRTISEVIGEEQVNEFARKMPLCYHRKTYIKLREFLEDKYSVKANVALKEMNVQSIYNLLGAYAWKYQKEDYEWIDTNKVVLKTTPFVQDTQDSKVVVLF